MALFRFLLIDLKYVWFRTEKKVRSNIIADAT